MQRQPVKYSKKQRGVALITALAIVSLASLAAVAMAHNMQLNIRRTTNILTTDQGFLYTLGSEAWSRGMLIRDLQDNEQKSYDGLDEDWAQELPPTPVEGGEVQALTTDLQARFNLNNLYLQNESTAEEKQEFALQLALFKRLLDLLELDESIAQATADWLDQDINLQFPDGAEDNEYLNTEQPYRTGNSPMGNPSEIRLVKGVSAEAYETLAPYITALPENTPININTASPQVLQALVNTLDEQTAEQLIDEREENPFKNKKSFVDRLKDLLDENKVKSQDIDPLISVTSRFYQLETTVRMEFISQQLHSLLYKGDKDVVTLSRSIGAF
ncbi:MAG: type II secretion system minor pseudopilin GspK [Candidatus Thiodiazotropha sp. (ex Myrtea sp. 'scaly one' KF741663)]|nr:type II secretion system minor pseudopilin GspK [Candidatus Thiodiazotropha sp. (ex Myrtea sp. 'scaly one' KF741663)]